MSYTFATSSTAGNASGDALAVTKPASTVDGDLLIAIFYWEGSGQTITPPTGWNVLRTYDRNTAAATPFLVISYYKWASAEPASWTWTPSLNANWRTAVCARYTPPSTGTGAVDDIDNGTVANNAASISIPAVTTTHNSETVLGIVGSFSGNVEALTAGETVTAIRAQIGGLAIADGVLTTAGATTICQFTDGTDYYAGQQVALLDNTGGGGGGTVSPPPMRTLRGIGV